MKYLVCERGIHVARFRELADAVVFVRTEAWPRTFEVWCEVPARDNSGDALNSSLLLSTEKLSILQLKGLYAKRDAIASHYQQEER